MKTLIDIDIPETDEELVYLQLTHGNQYNKHVISALREKIGYSDISYNFTTLSAMQLDEFVRWLPTQQLIGIEFSNVSSGVKMTFIGDTNASLTIRTVHQDWFYHLSSIAVNWISMDAHNGNV